MNSSNVNYWLYKSEPNVYSIDQLKKDKKTKWNGVRNYQARNFLNEAKKGDLAFIYHSNLDKAVVGVAKVVKEAFPEPDPTRKGDWVQIELGYVKHFKTPVTLDAIKKTASLKNMFLVKQSRLSCMPVTQKEFETICKMGGVGELL